MPSDVQDVADADLALGEHDDAADEILDQRLGAEAEADGERAAEEREDRERDLEEMQSVPMASRKPTTIISQLRRVLAWASAMWPRVTRVLWMRLAILEAIQ